MSFLTPEQNHGSNSITDYSEIQNKGKLIKVINNQTQLIPIAMKNI